MNNLKVHNIRLVSVSSNIVFNFGILPLSHYSLVGG